MGKVVFVLHESFHKPKRICKEPPYKVSETGYGSFNLPVEVYFRNKEEPRKYRLEYDLTLQLVGMPPYNFTKVELLTFVNPSEDFEKKLHKGGAVILGKESPTEGGKTTPTTNSPTTHTSPNGTKKEKSSKKKDAPSGTATSGGGGSGEKGEKGTNKRTGTTTDEGGGGGTKIKKKK